MRIFDIFLYPHNDPDHSQNLMGSKLEQDPSSYFSFVDLISSICVILLTDKQTNGHEFKTSLVEVTI